MNAALNNDVEEIRAAFAALSPARRKEFLRGMQAALFRFEIRESGRRKALQAKATSNQYSQQLEQRTR